MSFGSNVFYLKYYVIEVSYFPNIIRLIVICPFAILGSGRFTNCHLTVLRNTGWLTVIRSNDIRSFFTAPFKSRVDLKTAVLNFRFCRRQRCRRRRWR